MFALNRETILMSLIVLCFCGLFYLFREVNKLKPLSAPAPTPVPSQTVPPVVHFPVPPPVQTPPEVPVKKD